MGALNQQQTRSSPPVFSKIPIVQIRSIRLNDIGPSTATAATEKNQRSDKDHSPNWNDYHHDVGGFHHLRETVRQSNAIMQRIRQSRQSRQPAGAQIYGEEEQCVSLPVSVGEEHCVWGKRGW
eukprot:c6062_g1_i1 orf=74-442(-)